MVDLPFMRTMVAGHSGPTRLASVSVPTVRLGKFMSSCGALGVSSYENPIRDLLRRNHGETPVLDRLNTFQASLAESWANRYDA